jgi:hypothetical protein
MEEVPTAFKNGRSRVDDAIKVAGEVSRFVKHTIVW